MIFTLDEDLDIGSWMPIRLGSVGNFPTGDLVAMLPEMGIVTGIDPEQVVVAWYEIARMLGIDPQSYRGKDGQEIAGPGRKHWGKAVSALGGIRVLDLGTFIAGPHCATILGEFGAEVIKVEPPKTGDSLRRLGTNTECGDTLVWLSEARNKKCVTLDLASERGRELLKQLAAKCDIIVENFRPGTLEKWGLGYDELKKINPGAILVRISAYGQDGPMRTQPGFARIAHAFSGLTYLAGEPGGIPVVPGSTSLADYMSGMYGAIGALVALQARKTTGEGQCVDLALYESVFRVLDEIAPAYQKFGYVRERMGADAVNVCPHSHYQTKDGKWIAIACTSDAMFVRLAHAMEQPELASAERYGPQALRLAARDEVNRIVAAWVVSLDLETVLGLCSREGVPASLIFSIADIFEDAQYRARGNIQMTDSRAGEIAVPGVVPRLSETPGEIRWLGAGLGAQNEDVYKGLLELSSAEIEDLRISGVI